MYISQQPSIFNSIGSSHATLLLSLFLQLWTPFQPGENRISSEEELSVSDVQTLQKSTWSWKSHVGPILGFKLMSILSGSTSVQGSILHSTMSPDLKAALQQVAKQLTEPPGWPQVFEEAFIAHLNNAKAPTAITSITPNGPTMGTVFD
ncbi:hypothetical protein GYMLUDRAFT_65300 [Collybiopsis luxurians FD-317 M1]|uniref:Uncharacterized protein n=1 Tax=Collybiopsis luxurians FD-317 M1 TaxID=944289 RepID=A0A0D0AJM6_9AGAR|nr:hypothetical protein GYMLUDRAFT_65300 [Collybiopsis luxurians FD-317 M1]